VSFARDLVALFEDLRESEECPDMFGPDAEQWLAQSAEAAPALAALRRASSPEKALKAALQALAVQRELLEPRLLDAAFVATFPGAVPFGARPTELVLGEMLGTARSEVIALGYEVTHAGTIELLRGCAMRGARVVLICDRARLDVDLLLRGWPDACQPDIYTDCERGSALAYSKMHCKALLVDEEDLLVTSANFTLHGLRGNIEFGVRLRGAPARDARDVFRHLLRSGLLERLASPPAP
jgi:phosphatidylserine/phosphatidylglycerophosphate/cardiolipin synthase-like enzyme